MKIANPDDDLNPFAKNAANVNAETIYSLIVGDYATVNQQIIQQQRKRGLFQLAGDDRDFTGRSQETEIIEKILKGDSPTAMISAVSGMGGVGKSVLARFWAGEVGGGAGRWADGDGVGLVCGDGGSDGWLCSVKYSD